MVPLRFAVGLCIGGSLSELVFFWGVPGAGFGAAAAVVLGVYVFAPAHKRTAAALMLLVGAYVAWGLVAPPAVHSRRPATYLGYGEPSHVPIVVTYLGGALAWLACLLHVRRQGQPIRVLPRMSWRAWALALAGVVLLAWLRWPPSDEELQAEGQEIVDALRATQLEHGRYPRDLDELEGLDLTRHFGGWQYRPVDGGFRLGIGHYLEHGFALSYDTTWRGEWYLDR